MKIDFCPHCGGPFKPEKVYDKNFLVCTKCGHHEIPERDMKFVEEETHKKIGVGVVADKNVYATYDNKCKKCGYEKAEVIDVGVLISDEDNLILLKCGKCGFSERIGRKTS